MKIVLIYRGKREGSYSIEGIFHTVADKLRKQVEVIEYEAGTRREILRDVWRLRNLGADIYHVTGDIGYIVLLLPHKKTVLTVHDIGHYLFGLRGLRRWIYRWLWLEWPIRVARAVTAVSNETRSNIVRHLRISESRIETIENCHSAVFKRVSRAFNVACPVILQVGTRPYKNVPRLIEALQGIKCRLVLVGPLETMLVRKLAECGVAFVNRVNLTHAEIYRQYMECDIVSFVSIGEGFGMPIIEAQATGRPLITSKASPMREVAGEGACLVDPLDVSQIREAISKIIVDPDYRGQLVEQGLRNVARYTPATISGQYLALYKRIACL